MRQPGFTAALSLVAQGRFAQEATSLAGAEQVIPQQVLLPAPRSTPVWMRPELCEFLPGFKLVETCTPGEFVCGPICVTNPYSGRRICSGLECKWKPAECWSDCVRVGFGQWFKTA
jgi:hypothetical protein